MFWLDVTLSLELLHPIGASQMTVAMMSCAPIKWADGNHLDILNGLAEPESNALDLPVNLPSNPPLRS